MTKREITRLNRNVKKATEASKRLQKIEDEEYQRLLRDIIPLVKEIQRLKKLKRQLHRRIKGTNRSRKTNTV